MEESAKPFAVSENKDVSMLGRALQWAVYPFAAAAGMFVSHINIRNSAYDNVKWTEAFGKEKSNYKKAMLEVGEKAQQHLAAGKTFDFAAATKPIVEAHDAKITESLHALNVGTLSKQWHINSPYQKQNAVLNGLTAFGIVVAVGAMITDSKLFRSLFSENKEQTR
jgi:uncharacterized membrane protein YcjF (UPF0283 family)